MECIFCKIINKQIPSDIIYEDKDVICFLDINPIARGHALLLPKKHFNHLLEVDKKTLGILLKKIKFVAENLIKATESEGFNLLLNNRKAAGQVIDHIHFHIIPRKENDGVKLDWSSKYIYKDNEKKQIIKKFKELIKI
ncbi:MAG: HIT family protein [Candidatus Pacearchaeota archaeon]